MLDENNLTLNRFISGVMGSGYAVNYNGAVHGQFFSTPSFKQASASQFPQTSKTLQTDALPSLRMPASSSVVLWIVLNYILTRDHAVR